MRAGNQKYIKDTMYFVFYDIYIIITVKTQMIRTHKQIAVSVYNINSYTNNFRSNTTANLLY